VDVKEKKQEGREQEKVAKKGTKGKERREEKEDRVFVGEDNNDVGLISKTENIYQCDQRAAIVVEEYKFIFFPIAKNACTEWRKLLYQMVNHKEFKGSLQGGIHNPENNNLTMLCRYNALTATKLLTQPDWTRAVFLREPKERILSSYLNKVVSKNIYKQKCCKKEISSLKMGKKSKESLREKCTEEFDAFLFFAKPGSYCSNNNHWKPQASRINLKWWPYINFIGYHQNVAEDSKRLLSSLVSLVDGRNAWEKFGRTGWGPNHTMSFMQNSTSSHKTDAKEKLRRYYTPQTEDYVEKYWGMEWTHPYFDFEPIKIFADERQNMSSSHENIRW